MKGKSAFGRIHEVRVKELAPEAVLLEGEVGELRLTRRELERDARVGDPLRVFLYRDSEGAEQVSLRLPLAEVGDFAALRARKVLRAGVIFELGRGFELPVAAEEIPFRAKANERTLVRVELDEDGSLCGSCRIQDFLEKPQGLRVGQSVELQVWRQTDLGVKMIIEGRFEGLLYTGELSAVQPGQKLNGFVARIREDGKVDLSLNPGGQAGTDLGREKILAALAESGFLPLHDASPPDEIRRILGLSKKQFKRAVGSLYKEKKIELLGKGIRLRS